MKPASKMLWYKHIFVVFWIFLLTPLLIFDHLPAAKTAYVRAAEVKC